MVQITHIRFSGGGVGAQHIEDFRWYDPRDGDITTSTSGQMVEYLRLPNARAYVCDGYHIADVEVVAEGTPYLRTVRHGVVTDDLLRLPRF